MKPTLSDKIFQTARDKGLEPHSITNGCVLNLSDGNCVVADSKRKLLDKITKL
jgi:hypothetical protein